MAARSACELRGRHALGVSQGAEARSDRPSETCARTTEPTITVASVVMPMTSARVWAFANSGDRSRDACRDADELVGLLELFFYFLLSHGAPGDNRAVPPVKALRTRGRVPNLRDGVGRASSPSPRDRPRGCAPAPRRVLYSPFGVKTAAVPVGILLGALASASSASWRRVRTNGSWRCGPALERSTSMAATPGGWPRRWTSTTG